MSDSPESPSPARIEQDSRSPLTQQEMFSPESVAHSATPGGTVEYTPSAEAKTATPLLSSKNPLPTIPGYALLSVLGRGGMGVVYKARQIKANRLVALKMILSGSHADESELARFRTEAEAIARLQHPHIVQVFDVGEHESQPFFSLEFCGGGSLARQLHGTPLPPRDAAGLVAVLADAIQAAHLKGIIHRDLKPANVLLQRDDADANGLTMAMLKITDFGLAKKVEDAGQTASGVIMGTPSYMAPEQASGDSRRIGPSVDIYALGAILYELLTGRPPFRAATPMDTVLQVLRDEPVRPRQLQPKTPRDVETICLKCLHKDPLRRYATAAELSADLQRFLRGEPIQARPVGRAERAAKWTRRRPAAASLLAVIAAAPLIALLLAGWYLKRQEQFNRQLEGERNTALEQKGIAESNGVEAKQQSIEANKQKKRAQEAYRDSQLRLMQMHVATGVRLMEDGDSFEALPWLVTALKEDPRDEAMREMHRYRIGALLRQSPKLTRMFFHPANMAHHVEFSPDGRKLLTTCDDNMARIWDLATGKEVHSLRHIRTALVGAMFSPDGQRLFTVGDDHKVHVVDTATGKTMRTIAPSEGLDWACLSPNGQRLFVVSAGRRGRVWDAQTGEAVTPALEHADQITHASFSRDGRLVATASKDATARVWDATTGKLVTPSLQHPPAVVVNGAIFSPDGKHVATVSSDWKLRLWGVTPGEARLEWATPDGGTNEVLFSPDGSRLVSCSTANLWDAKTGRRIGQLQHNATVYHVAFSPDGRWVATTSEDMTARVWDAATGLPVTPPLKHSYVVLEVAFSPDGRFLATGCHDGAARIWDLGEAKPFTSWSNVGQLRDLSPDTRYAVVLSPPRSSVYLLDARTGARVGSFWQLPTAFGYVSFSPDSRLLVAACTDKTARIWDIASSKERGSPLQHDSDILIAAVSPDATRLATGCKDGTAHVWDLSTGKEIYLPLRHTDSLLSIRFSADGQRLLTAGKDSKARIWDAATGRPITPFVLHGPSERAAWMLYSSDDPAWSPDGKLLASRIFGFTARAWDAVSGQPAGPPLDHSGGLATLMFSPDSSRLLSTSNDGTALQWDAVTGKRLTPAMRHGGFVRYGSYSPDGRRIATTEDSAARIWDAATGLSLTPPLKNAQGGHEVRFSPDGRRLFRWFYNSQDLSVWDVSRDDRPLEDLVKLTNLLASHQFDANGGKTPLTRDELRKSWQELCAKYPQNNPFLAAEASTLRRQARSAESKQQWPLAISFYDQLLALTPKDGEIWLQKGMVHASLRQSDKAIVAYEQAIAAYTEEIALHPQDYRRWHGRAIAYSRTKQYASAIKDCSHVLAVCKNDFQSLVRCQTLRAHCYSQLKLWEKAAADYAKLMEGRLSGSDPWNYYAMSKLAMNDLAGYRKACAEMARRFNYTIKKSGNWYEVHITALTCTAVPDALPDFTPLRKQLEQIAADNPALRFDTPLSYVYYRMGDYPKALEQLNKIFPQGRKSVESIDVGKFIDPRSVELWFFLAMVHHRLGHAEEAKKWFDMAERRLANAPPAEGGAWWVTYVKLQFLHREAKALLNEKKK